MKIHNVAVILMSVILLSSCGGDSSSSSASPDPQTSTVQTFHGNGAVESEGAVDTDGDKQGRWKWYYDDGQLRTEVLFVDNVFEEGETWVVYNQDSSVRADSTDGAYVFPVLW